MEAIIVKLADSGEIKTEGYTGPMEFRFAEHVYYPGKFSGWLTRSSDRRFKFHTAKE